MKVYVVVATEGDYIGYFSSYVRGVFLDKYEADMCADKAREDLVKYNAEVVVCQEELRFGEPRDPDYSKPCTLCKGEGLGDWNYACAACAGSGVRGF